MLKRQLIIQYPWLTNIYIENNFLRLGKYFPRYLEIGLLLGFFYRNYDYLTMRKGVAFCIVTFCLYVNNLTLLKIIITCKLRYLQRMLRSKHQFIRISFSHNNSTGQFINNPQLFLRNLIA